MPDAVIALDVGEARIGVARGEIGSGFAFGRGHIRRTSLAEDVAAVKAVARDEGAALVIVGLPVRTDGSDSEQTLRVRAFAKALDEAGLEVVTEDERFTTKMAGQRIKASGIGRRKRQEKGRIDEESAVLILESYLARRRSRE